MCINCYSYSSKYRYFCQVVHNSNNMSWNVIYKPIYSLSSTLQSEPLHPRQIIKTEAPPPV